MRFARADVTETEDSIQPVSYTHLQKLESTWRGLHYLCQESNTGPMLKIKVLNVTKRDLVRDLSLIHI